MSPDSSSLCKRVVTILPSVSKQQAGAVRLSSQPLWLLIVAFGLQACSGEPAAEIVDVEAPVAASQPNKVVLYSAVSPSQLTPLIDAYTAESGTEIEVIFEDYPRLFANMENHGTSPAADMIIASSVAELMHAAEHDLFRPLYEVSLFDQVEENLLDPEKYWFPLSARARVVVVNTDLVANDERARITNYASLQDELWRERICVSSSRIAGNRLLISMLLGEFNKRDAELIVRGWLANDSDGFYEDDFALLRAVASGQCQVAIADLSALAMHLNVRPDAPIAVLDFSRKNPVLIDISGVAVSRHAKNAAGATDFLKWLGTEQANRMYAVAGLEFPLTAELGSNSPLTEWSHLVEQSLSVSQIGMQHEEAVLLAQRARYP